MKVNKRGQMEASAAEAQRAIEGGSMRRVKLVTRDGQEVGIDLMVPATPDEVRYEGILWGNRTFFQTEDPETYREGMLYAAPIEIGE